MAASASPDSVDDVRPPSAADLAALKDVPDVEAALRREFEIGGAEGRGVAAERAAHAPALNVRGLQAGRVGARATNSIPTEACAFARLPPRARSDAGVGARQVERHVAAQGYTIVRERARLHGAHGEPAARAPRMGAGLPPARTALDLPLSRQIAALMAAAGRDPVRLPTLGAAFPCTSSSSRATGR
jgi:hypothetical protein